MTIRRVPRESFAVATKWNEPCDPSTRWSRNYPASVVRGRTGRGPVAHQRAIARVAGEVRGAFERDARFVAASELQQQIGADRVQQAVVAQLRRIAQGVDQRQRRGRTFGARWRR